jgi:hypothetical protein
MRFVIKELKNAVIVLDAEGRLTGIKAEHIDYGSEEEQYQVMEIVGGEGFKGTTKDFISYSKK